MFPNNSEISKVVTFTAALEIFLYPLTDKLGLNPDTKTVLRNTIKSGSNLWSYWDGDSVGGTNIKYGPGHVVSGFAKPICQYTIMVPLLLTGKTQYLPTSAIISNPVCELVARVPTLLEVKTQEANMSKSNWADYSDFAYSKLLDHNFYYQAILDVAIKSSIASTVGKVYEYTVAPLVGGSLNWFQLGFLKYQLGLNEIVPINKEVKGENIKIQFAQASTPQRLDALLESVACKVSSILAKESDTKKQVELLTENGVPSKFQTQLFFYISEYVKKFVNGYVTTNIYATPVRAGQEYANILFKKSGSKSKDKLVNKEPGNNEEAVCEKDIPAIHEGTTEILNVTVVEEIVEVGNITQVNDEL